MDEATGGPTDQQRIWSHFQNEGQGFADSHPRLESLVRTIAQLARGSSPSVLNIGVGDGWLEHRALGRGWTVASLDPDERAIARLNEAGVDARVGMIERLPHTDESFDFVVASEVLEHLDANQRNEGLAGIARVLRPGGWFLGTVPHDERLAEQETVCPHCGEVFHRWGHHASFTLADVRRMLSDRFDRVLVGRTAFVDLFGRGLGGFAKGIVRIGLARLGVRIAVPTIYWRCRRPR